MKPKTFFAIAFFVLTVILVVAWLGIGKAIVVAILLAFSISLGSEALATYLRTFSPQKAPDFSRGSMSNSKPVTADARGTKEEFKSPIPLRRRTTVLPSPPPPGSNGDSITQLR